MFLIDLAQVLSVKLSSTRAGVGKLRPATNFYAARKSLDRITKNSMLPAS